jgi:hypothetical protein
MKLRKICLKLCNTMLKTQNIVRLVTDRDTLFIQHIQRKSAFQIKYPKLTDSYLTSIGIDPTTTAWQTLEIDWCAIQSCLIDNNYAFVPAGDFSLNESD